jgi:hypothetical protein
MDHYGNSGEILGLLDTAAALNQLAPGLGVMQGLVSCACQQVQGVSKSKSDACQCGAGVQECGTVNAVLEYRCGTG